MRNPTAQEIDLAISEGIIPKWMNECPMVFSWCRYNGQIYFASLNYEESEKAQWPVFDLAYCATKAMNNIFLFQRKWDKTKFCRWKNNSNW